MNFHFLVVGVALASALLTSEAAAQSRTHYELEPGGLERCERMERNYWTSANSWCSDAGGVDRGRSSATCRRDGDTHVRVEGTQTCNGAGGQEVNVGEPRHAGQLIDRCHVQPGGKATCDEKLTADNVCRRLDYSSSVSHSTRSTNERVQWLDRSGGGVGSFLSHPERGKKDVLTNLVCRS